MGIIAHSLLNGEVFMVWKWLKRRYTKRSMENHLKVQQQIDLLNSNDPQKPWFTAEGFHSLNTFKFAVYGQGPKFNSNEGIPIKVFINRLTGEFRIFSAYLFKD